MPKRIYILNGHPAENSLSKTFAKAYAARASKAGHEVRVHHIHDLAFDMDFERAGYGDVKPLEPDLEAVVSHLEWAEHFVLFTPMWWGSVPGKLKGLFDRALLPGRTYDTRNTNAVGMPSPMLKGRTGRVVVTSDTPTWFLKLLYRNPIAKTLRHHILHFIGIKPVSITQLSPASHPSEKHIEKWTTQVEGFAARAA